MGIIQFLKYKWKYQLSLFLKNFTSVFSGNNKYLFVTHIGTKDWILGAKARRLSENTGLNAEVYYATNYKNIPDAEGYFFLHQKYFARAIRYNPHILRRKKIVMFTHPEWNQWYSEDHMAYVLDFADEIVCLNSSVAEQLRHMGIDQSKIHMYHMASDPQMFTSKQRTGDGAIGFSMNYGFRKRPEMVVQLIKELPQYNFILIGPNWDKYDAFREIKNAPNLKYYSEVDYSLYPSLYHEMDVYVSTSILEGGPVPILEAMLSNVVPVASRTGFCPDVIIHGENGFLFDIHASVDQIKQLIEQAYLLKSDVRKGIEVHSWKNYGKKIADLFANIKLDRSL